MLIDADTMDDGLRVDADCAVAGAGAAGISIARELAGRGLKVCLLEGGSGKLEERSQSLYQGDCEPPLDDDYLARARLRMFGGTTVIWLGYCRPLDDVDFARRDWVPDSGWPFERSVLAPYFERAAAVCQVPNAFVTPPLSDSGISRCGFQVNPLRFGGTYGDALKLSDNVLLFLNANLLRVRLTENGSAVDHLEVESYTRKRLEVRARAFVLALGGIENARCLLVSNDVNKAGVGNDHDLVGRFFMEHPAYSSHAEICLATGTPFSEMARVRNDGIYRLSDALQENEGLLNASFTLFPEGMTDPFAALTGGRWDATSEHLAARGLAGGPGDGKAGGSEVFAPTRIGIRMEHAPNASSRVTLGEEADAFGLPKVHLAWRKSALDDEATQRFLEVLARELGRRGWGRLRQTAEPGQDYVPGFHHMGTTRMHDRPAKGVVDSDGRVHAVDNLYMAGSSVFPTSGYANPTFTLVALALRLADTLGRRLA